jgi:hypothetical protein
MEGVQRSLQGATLVDLLDRILDKGLVVAGDIVVQLADVELLTIKIRLIVCSVDKAQEIGMDWWKHDAFLSSTARTSSKKENMPKLFEKKNAKGSSKTRTDNLSPLARRQNARKTIIPKNTTSRRRRKATVSKNLKPKT